MRGPFLIPVAPWEALTNNSRAFSALQDALRSGRIAKALARPVRETVPGTRPMKQVTPAVLEELVADHGAGLGVYQLAEKHGLHRYTVARHLTAAGVVMRRTITEAERKQARDMYLSGATFREIAKRLGRDPATVAKIVRQGSDARSPRV